MANTLLKSAFFIMIITLIGRVMGLVRITFITHQFGTDMEASAYILAFTIPSTLFVFVPGALNAIFIPSLKGLLTLGKETEARALFQKIMTVSLLVNFVLCLVGWIWAKPILTFISPKSSPELLVLAADLLRWMIPSILFIALIGVFSSTLNVHNSFVIPNVGVIMNSAVLILVILLFTPMLHIYALALGTTLGFAAAALIMLPKIMVEKYSLRPNWQWRDQELRRIGERFVPIMLGSFITSINEFIEKFMVSGYGDDKFAALGYAKQVYQVPMAIFIAAFVMPLFPLMVESIKKENLKHTKETIEKGLTYLLILMIPTTVGMIAYGKEFVAALLQRGAFDAHSTEITSFALIFFTLGLYPLAIRDLLTRAFYALENTIIPVLAGIAQILFYIAGTLLFLPLLGFAGAAMGWTIGAVTGAILLWVILQRKIGRFVEITFLWSILKVSLASLMMIGFIYLFKYLSANWNIYIELVCGVGIAAILYGTILVLLKEPLTLELFLKLKRKIGKQKLNELS